MGMNDTGIPQGSYLLQTEPWDADKQNAQIE